MTGPRRAVLRLTSVWSWPPVALTLVSIAGWWLGRLAALATAAGLLLLGIGMAIGLVVAAAGTGRPLLGTTGSGPGDAAAGPNGGPPAEPAGVVGGDPGTGQPGRHARLQGANLRNAMLARADLRFADLRGAELSGADLQGADLRGAILAPLDEAEGPAPTAR